MEIFIEKEKQEEIRKILEDNYFDNTELGIEKFCKKHNLYCFFADCEPEAYISISEIEDCSIYVQL